MSPARGIGTPRRLRRAVFLLTALAVAIVVAVFVFAVLVVFILDVIGEVLVTVVFRAQARFFLGVRLLFGDFKVAEGESKQGGPLCEFEWSLAARCGPGHP